MGFQMENQMPGSDSNPFLSTEIRPQAGRDVGKSPFWLVVVGIILGYVMMSVVHAKNRQIFRTIQEDVFRIPLTGRGLDIRMAFLVLGAFLTLGIITVLSISWVLRRIWK